MTQTTQVDQIKAKKNTENMFFPSPDLKPVQMLWHNLKKHVLSKQPRNIDKLKQIFEGRDGPKLFKIRKKIKKIKKNNQCFTYLLRSAL